MLHRLLELIIAVESQDLIADVANLEARFNVALDDLKKLALKEQQEIIQDLHMLVYTKYSYPKKSWRNISDLQNFFLELTQKHKIARAKDAGEKILHAMYGVLQFNTPEEFAMIKCKYATNHDQHARDVAAAAHPAEGGAAIAGVEDAFVGAVKVGGDGGIRAILSAAAAAAQNHIGGYDVALAAYREAVGGAADAAPPAGVDGALADTLRDAQGAIARLDLMNHDANPDNLQAAFAAFVGLRQAHLAFEQANVVPQMQHAANVAEAEAAARELVAAFRGFVELPDAAEAAQGFIAALNAPHQGLVRDEDGAIAVFNAVINRLPEDARAAPRQRVLDAVARMQVGGADIGALEAAAAAAPAPADVQARFIRMADRVKSKKAEARAVSAGAAILAKFGEVADAPEVNAAALLQQYNDNHNMHALNVLEHTTEGDELREIMFAEMEKGLPFESHVIRDLDLLKEKFMELVRVRVSPALRATPFRKGGEFPHSN